MMRRPFAALLLASLTAGLVACHAIPPVGPFSQRSDSSTASSAQANAIPPLVGTVDFKGTPRQTQSLSRRVQAGTGDVVYLATVSLISTITGQTVTSGITDGSGNFSLPLSTYVPSVGSTYILEAVKGLNAQLPGNDAARFRTIVTYTSSGWQSITNYAVPGPIIINALSTSVALESGLDQAAMPYSGTMGMVNAQVTPPALNATPSFVAHPPAEILNLSSDILSLLANNLDPVSITNGIKPSLTSLNPTNPLNYAPVTINGSGFVPGATVVSFGGVTAPIMQMTSAQIIATVPAGAITGNLTVSTVRGGTSNALAYTVPAGSGVAIQTVSPNPARPNATITIAGSGFSPTLANDLVSLNGVALTPVFANQTTVVVTLPSNATGGLMTVTVNGASSNSYFLSVDQLASPQITSLFPNTGAVDSVVSIKGINFGPAGNVVMGTYPAKVISWNPSVVRVQVPYYVNSGASTITLFGQFGTATASYTVLNGNVGAFVQTTSMNSTGGAGMYAAVGDGKLWTWGGAGSTAVNYMPLNPDGSFAAGAWTTSALTLPYGTIQDDNPNADTLVQNRIYYTVSNTSNKVNFAQLDPYTGDIIGFGYDPTNDMPPSWLGKDLGLASSDKYVYILGAGVSCSGANGGTGCGGNATNTMQARILPHGGIGVWQAGPNNFGYGEDAIPFYIGGVLHLLGGNLAPANQTDQFSVIQADGTMGTWATSSIPLLPKTQWSSRPVRVGRNYYIYSEADGYVYQGAIQNDLILTPMASTSTIGMRGDSNRIELAIGAYVYSLGGNTGSVYQNAVYRAQVN